jgi:hypothetical protein
MEGRVDLLFCPMCGDCDFYTSEALPSGSFRWVVDSDGNVGVRQGDDELAVVTAIPGQVYCSGCHSLVVGTAIARANVRHT